MVKGLTSTEEMLILLPTVSNGSPLLGLSARDLERCSWHYDVGSVCSTAPLLAGLRQFYASEGTQDLIVR